MNDIRARRRQAILNAAIDEFCRCGFERARMDAIAARAGIGKSTIYEYFPSKLALLEAVGEMMYNRIAEEVGAIMNADTPFRTKAIQYIRMLERLMDQIGEHGMALFRQEASSLRICDELAHRYLEEVWGTLRTAVMQAQEAGELRSDVDPQLVVSMLIALPHPPIVRRKRLCAEDYIDMLMQGIAP